MRKLGLVVFLSLTVAAGIHHTIRNRYQLSGSLFTQMLYLPPASYLRHVSFGYESLVADFVYLWSIQYYGEPLFKPKLQYLEHTYNIISDLDPQFLDAYQTGALFMFYDGRSPEAGLRLLQKGIENNPNEWILPTDAGFYCMMNLRDNKKAAYYFERASKIPDAPTLVTRMLAGTEFRMGDKRHALQLWTHVYEIEPRATVKQIAFQHMHELKVLIDLEEARKALAAFQRDRGRYPATLEQLVETGYLTFMPSDPEGNPYDYEPGSGAVSYKKSLRIYHRFQ